MIPIIKTPITEVKDLKIKKEEHLVGVSSSFIDESSFRAV
jgi:hypothetical protein